ncbi:unnamed protein product [Dicrocoelium dendriticum]|nr:unnamed protein product [Dicrocoelium dendriticum]
MEDSEQAYDDEDSGGRRALSTGSSLFQQFYSAIDSGDPMSADSVRNTCVIATATTTDGILRSPEGRQLFFRQILVPLPDAHTRHCILRQEILMRVHNSSLCQQTGDMLLPDMNGFPQLEEKSEQLLNLASKLHGYTPRDLHRLVQISWASLLSSLLVRSPGDASDSVAPTLAALCDVLARESRTYMQINLSQFTTPVSPLRWDDIGGYEHLKTLFRTVVQNRLATAAKLNSDEALADAALGLRVPRGILLHGPPGCSKTMFVRALATECQLPLIAVQASRIFGRYVGDSERNMRRILVQARASAPAILFIDEIDLLLPSRSSSETGASEHVLSEVLTAMDGVEGQIGQVILIAATNRMEKLDSALSRAGRFDLVIDVPPPDAAARAAILRLELSRRALDDALSLQTDWLNDFAKSRLHDYTGAEVVQVVQLAAQLARNSGRNRISRSCLLRAQEECPPVSLNRYSSSCVPPCASLTNHLHQIFMLLPKSLLFASFSIFLIIGLVFYACFSNYP